MDRKCFVCGVEAETQPDLNNNSMFYQCNICGRYEITITENGANYNKNMLASYLYHKAFYAKDYSEYRYHTSKAKEWCDEYKAEYEIGNNVYGCPVHMDMEMIANWYPNTFSERLDYIMLKLDSMINHVGKQISLSLEELKSLLFVDRYDVIEPTSELSFRSHKDRSVSDIEDEVDYMLKYLAESGFVELDQGDSEAVYEYIRITPAGYDRVDKLQKNTSYGRSVLVAMKFGEDTLQLREAIRKGVSVAGFVPVFIDEVQHNDFITPELLKHIRDSKFVVVDLTHKNNGAYFEEGYAMGLGKPVIQLCKQGTQLHFDIAQKNTIMWDSEDNLSEKLTNRIKATID